VAKRDGETFDTSDWLRACPKDIPTQENDRDCGVFMLKYADYVARGLDLDFTQSMMPYFRRQVSLSILQGEDCATELEH
jgi:Ulp1 family protease